MANTKHKRTGVLIGVEGLVFAQNLTDDGVGATYETDIHEVPGTIEIALTANVSDEALGADDNPTWEVFSALDSLDASVTVASLGKPLEKFLLGRTVDGNGVMLVGSIDAPPWVAMGFKTRRSDGSLDLIWLYKGKFKQGDMTFHTREKGSVNWQTPALTATFGPRDFDKNLMARVNDRDTGLGANTIGTFFASVYEPAPESETT